MVIVASAAYAVPAKKMWRTFQQMDGTSIQLMLVGDENLHYYKTKDDVPVVEENDGFFYAKKAGFAIKSSGVLAHELELRTSADVANTCSLEEIESVRAFVKTKGPKRIGEPEHPSYTGKKKGLIILANFADRKFYDYDSASNGNATWARYDALVNEEGYTNEKYGAIGSVHDYYSDMSYNKFNLTFDVVGPVNLEHEYSYYGSGTDDMHASRMIVECCNAVDAEVDFNDYDWDNDGVVEEVFVLYAGYGEATGGPRNTIWPHMWTLTDAANYDSEIPKELVLDGALIDVYACSNELYSNTGTTEMGLGVICHEFSHCLGLPDLYDTGYGGNFGMGAWDILDSGSYNGPQGIGWVPAGYSSYERNYAGWVKFTELKTPRRVINQKPLSERGTSYIIYNEAYPDEYYLLENRKQTGWDAYIPGAGLLIVHVDYDQDIWASNNVNTTGAFNNHQRLTVFHASNSTYGGNEAYPYNGNNSLTDFSTPKASLYNDNPEGAKLMSKPITEITRNEETGYISFLFRPDNSQLDANSSIEGIEQAKLDEHAVLDVYTLDGKKIASQVSRDEVSQLPAGNYIVRQNDGTSVKMAVR